MSYRPGDAYYAEFTTSNPSTGAAQNADSLPVATANHNGTDDGAFTLTVANLDTGRYKVTGTIPSGYASGDVVNVTVAATVAAVAGKAVLDSFMIDRSFDPTKTVPVRNQDAVTAPTYNDAFLGAWCEAFGKETESDTAATYVKQKPDNSGAVRSFTLTEDSNGNPVGRA